MELFFRKLGSGPPLIILHGLYGAGDNWYSIARELSSSYTIYLPDQRNHGNSPHHHIHDYKTLSADLNRFMRRHKLSKAILMGHSMGGKTVIEFGLNQPEKVEKMIVVDISPLRYHENEEADESTIHRSIIKALQKLDIKNISERSEADRQLSEYIHPVLVRQFLLKSLKRRNDGHFEWALNLEALSNNMSAIYDGVISEDSTDPRSIPQFPLLFIKGGKSQYIRKHDLDVIEYYFPHAQVITIPDAGHWIHAEQPAAFLEALRRFLDENSPRGPSEGGSGSSKSIETRHA